jgi:hypothetical protein
MISYVKALCALVVIPVAAISFVGCSGFSDVDANDRCKQEQIARGASCFTNASFTSCVTAYEDCGDSVTSDSSACPLVYSCPD